MMDKLREQRVATTIEGKNYHAFKPVVKKVKLSNEYLNRKICPNIEAAVRACGLEDGMTVSFHHAYRGGDFVLNMVMDVLAGMGFRNLTVAASSLSGIHDPMIAHIENGVVRKIYTSGLRGKLAEFISHGNMSEPVEIHSHGGRVQLMQVKEIVPDIAFLAVPICDSFGNASGAFGRNICGSLGYAQTDATFAKKVVLITEEIAPYPFSPMSITQDQVDCIVEVEAVGDSSKIGAGATRMTTNPRELLIARKAADV
ncbi:citrate lyase subunit alpha, partial [Suttonella ornithocola]